MAGRKAGQILIGEEDESLSFEGVRSRRAERLRCSFDSFVI